MQRHLVPPRAAWIALLLVLIAAFGLRLWDLESPSVWHDEGWSIRAIRDPVGTPDDNTPPLYYATMHVLWLGAGESPLALRYGSVLLDLLMIALAAGVLRRRVGWDAGLLAALLLAVSPLLWAYAREIRAYVAVSLWAVALLALVDHLLTARARFPWRSWGVLLAAELALLYTHNLSVPVVGWLNIVVGGAYLWRRDSRSLTIWIAGQAALLVAYLPWLLGQSPSGTAINTPPSLRLSLVGDIGQAYYAPLPVMVGAESDLVAFSAMMGVLFVLSAVIVFWRGRTRFALLVLSQAVLLPVLATVELIAANIDFHPRYYVAGVPAALMLLAIAAARMPGRALRTGAWLVVAGVGIAAGLTGIDRLHSAPEYQRDDFRAIAEYYATLPDDALIVIPYGWEPALDVYYADRLDIRAEMLEIDLHSDPDTALDAINTALLERSGPVHVELLNWFQLPADLRGMYPCVLAAAGQRVDERVVQGIATTAYRVERPLAFMALDAPPVANAAATLAHAAASGESALCLRTDWQLNRAPDADLRVSARLLATDPPGWIVARSDSDMRSDEQEPTSALGSGDIASTFSLLALPPGAPPGEYDLRLVVFDAADLQGLDWAAEGVPVGQFVRLPSVMLDGNTQQAFEETPRQPEDIALTDALALRGLDARPGVLNAGQELRITVYWAAADCCRSQPWTGAEIVLRGDGWSLAQPVRVYGPYSLGWHAFRIPADAGETAELVLVPVDGPAMTLASYTIEQTERLFAPPAYDVPVGTAFGDLAVLEGFSVPQTTVMPEDTLELTLVWQALETSNTSYRVFTHLLNTEGRVIAQHDSYPVGGDRPTTGWVAGEYIVDTYHLVFDPEFTGYHGPARLEVGFYNPETGDRIPAAHGADHIVLPITIMVQ